MQRIISVTSPAATLQLASLANVKAELSISGSGSDSLLGRYINGASSRICKYLNRVLARQSYTETIRNNGTLVPDELMLSNFPLVSISSISEDGTALSGSDYEIRSSAISSINRLMSDSPVSWTAKKIVVSYTAGYLLANDGGRDLPQDIEDACISLVVSAFRAKGREAGIRSQSAEGVGSISYLDPSDSDGGLPDSVQKMLEPYCFKVI